jgi:hypothetical protein
LFTAAIEPLADRPAMGENVARECWKRESLLRIDVDTAVKIATHGSATGWLLETDEKRGKVQLFLMHFESIRESVDRLRRPSDTESFRTVRLLGSPMADEPAAQVGGHWDSCWIARACRGHLGLLAWPEISIPVYSGVMVISALIARTAALCPVQSSPRRIGSTRSPIPSTDARHT